MLRSAFPLLLLKACADSFQLIFALLLRANMPDHDHVQHDGERRHSESQNHHQNDLTVHAGRRYQRASIGKFSLAVMFSTAQW